MEELIKRIIPVFLIIFLGWVIKRLNIINDKGINTLKMLLVTIFLPASIFFAFIDARLSADYFFLFAGVFILCLLLYFAGFLFKKAGIIDSIYGAEFLTGFEFGMVGIALFTGIFGVKALPVISLIGLGHEFFIWFVYLPLLRSHSEKGRINFGEIVTSFFKSPIIISIITAVILNLCGASSFLKTNFISSGILTAAEWFAGCTVSIVLIVLGSSLKFENISLSRSLKFVIIRMIAVAVFSTGFYFAIINVTGNLPELFNYAWMTFFLLPPPYIIPIYVPSEHKKENIFLSNTIILYTLMSLVIFVIILFLFPPVI